MVRKISHGGMAYKTDRCQSKLHPPVRLQPRQPRSLQFVNDGEGGLQALALKVDETHPAGQTSGGLFTELPWQEEL